MKQKLLVLSTERPGFWECTCGNHKEWLMGVHPLIPCISAREPLVQVPCEGFCFSEPRSRKLTRTRMNF